MTNYLRKCFLAGILLISVCLACNSKLQLSSEKDIIEFRFAEYGIKGAVNNETNSVAVSVPVAVELSSLAPAITVSPGATVYPPSNQSNNFIFPQIYTVTAEDGSTQDYIVTVTVDSGVCLLIVDVQTYLFTLGIYNPGDLLDNIRTLLDGAHAGQKQVIYIQQTDDSYFIEGTDEWQIHIKIAPTEDDLVIQKSEPNSFIHTGLNSILHTNHIGILYIVGLVSNGCVEETCRGAHSLGYKVMLVRDAHSTLGIHPESLIEETNTTLEGEGIVELIYTDDVVFE